jgi:hypothetical protein
VATFGTVIALIVLHRIERRFMSSSESDEPAERDS